MKRSSKLTILFLLLALCLIAVSAQPARREPIARETLKPFNIDEYKDWKPVDIDKFSLYVPKNFKLEKWNGIDTYGWKYQNQNIIFNIASGNNMFDGPLYSDMDRPNYKEKFVSTGDGLFRTWSFEDKTPPEPFLKYPFVGHITFKAPKDNGNKHAITLWSKDSDGLKILEKILESIQFK